MVFTVLMCFIGPLIDGEGLLVAIMMGAFLLSLEVVMFASVKYQIDNGRLGVRNIFYRWEWFPIDKISEVKMSSGILAASALSTKRISIKFSDRKILKSYLPLEISPKDREGFIEHLQKINPRIIVHS